MKIVFVASPFAGDVETNVQYARMACLDCISRDESPFAPHLLYPQILDDTDEDDRKLGIECGKAWLLMSDELAVYTDLGISRGMQDEIATAKLFEISVVYRKLSDEKY